MNPPDDSAAAPSNDDATTERPRPSDSDLARIYLNLLEGLSLLYIVTPMAIYLGGWIRGPIGLPLVVALGVVAVLAYRAAVAAQTSEPTEEWRLTGRRLAAFAALVFGVVACTGIGGYSYQFFDYAFYDAVLKDLIVYPWPLAYEEAGPANEPMHLVIYAGYWFPAAIVGWLTGWEAAYTFQYIWASVGFLLIVLWFLRIARSASPLIVLLVLFFGGLDIVGRLLTESIAESNVSLVGYFTGEFWWSHGRGWLDQWSSAYARVDPTFSKEAGGVFFRFFSPLSFLVDGPHHILPGAIGFMMLLHDWWRKQSLHRSLLVWSCLPICSVFIAAGSFPFLLLAAVALRGRQLASLPNLFGLPLIAVAVAFFASVEGGRVSGWLWEFQNLGDTWPYLLLHYVVEFGLYAALIPVLRNPGYLPSPFWLAGALTMFLLSPFYRMGEYNDFTSKIVIPAQFVFILLLALSLRSAQSPAARIKRRVLVALLCIGALGPIGHLLRAADFGWAGSRPEFARVRHVNEVEPRILALQGMADPDSFYYRWLAPEVELQPTEPIEPVKVWDFTDPEMRFDYWIYFVDEENRFADEDGLHIITQGNMPLLRRDEVKLETHEIGMVRIEHEVLRNGEPAEDYQIVFQWTTPQQSAAAAEDEWPFPAWQHNQIWPIRSVISTNSYWRDIAEDIALYLQTPDDNAVYEAIVSEIALLER